jgi:3-deoxy-D-arabino-heptulosonate 7-phosphate (DAHP) synthase
MDFKRKLPIPMDIKAQFPITEEMQAVKEARDIEIAKVFKGESDKFILVIGPCSADRPEPVLRYVEKLADIQKKVEDKIINDAYKGAMEVEEGDKMQLGITGVGEVTNVASYEPKEEQEKPYTDADMKEAEDLF